jgi:hypothetical protein
MGRGARRLRKLADVEGRHLQVSGSSIYLGINQAYLVLTSG